MITGTQITVIGNLTADPELRFTPSGAAVAKFTVCVNKRVKDANGAWKDGEPSFYSVSAWRGLAENVAETLTRGMRVVVVGEISQRHWEDTKTGEKRSAFEVTADAVGPDLTWATAKVSKVSKSQGQGGGPADDPWATASTTRPAAAPAGHDGGHTQEPPF